MCVCLCVVCVCWHQRTNRRPLLAGCSVTYKTWLWRWLFNQCTWEIPGCFRMKMGCNILSGRPNLFMGCKNFATQCDSQMLICSGDFSHRGSDRRRLSHVLVLLWHWPSPALLSTLSSVSGGHPLSLLCFSHVSPLHLAFCCSFCWFLVLLTWCLCPV